MLQFTPRPQTSDPLSREFSREKPAGHYQIALSTGMLGYEIKANGTIQGEFYPLAAWGKSFLIEATPSGNITSLKVAQRSQSYGGARPPVHRSLSIAPLNPTSEEWERALERIRAGFDLYAR